MRKEKKPKKECGITMSDILKPLDMVDLLLGSPGWESEAVSYCVSAYIHFPLYLCSFGEKLNRSNSL